MPMPTGITLVYGEEIEFAFPWKFFLARAKEVLQPQRAEMASWKAQDIIAAVVTGTVRFASAELPEKILLDFGPRETFNASWGRFGACAAVALDAKRAAMTNWSAEEIFEYIVAEAVKAVNAGH